MKFPFFSWVHYHRAIFKSVTAFTLAIFLWAFIFPVVLAAKEASERSSRTETGTQEKRVSEEEELSRTLEEIEEKLGKLEEKLLKGEEDSLEKDDLKKLKKKLRKLDQKAKENFQKIEKDLKAKKLPQVILDRHYQALASYQTEIRTLLENLDAVEGSVDHEDRKIKAKKAKEHLEKKQKKHMHTPVDPDNLPHRTPKIKKQKPRLKKEEYSEFQNEPILLAYNGDPSAFLMAQVTQDLPTPEDLNETIEVQFAQDIQDLAAQLNNEPIKIYEWVRNNIEFVPTYGSIQGADMCLQTKQCNSFDTASLLIALLRVSNIPARYVHGAIEVPIDKAMNWAGGFTDPVAAGNFIVSGGTPAQLVTSDGQVIKIQMEHVWVEAYVDYIPSRGAVHKQGDTWIPLDASFKQYTYETGLDLYSSLSFNGDQFMSGYISDIQDITPYQQYGKQMLAWLDANMPTATIEDILGAQDLPSTKVINQHTFPYLLGTLPYKVVVQGSKYSTVPDSMRHKVTLQISTDMFGEGGSSVTETLPELSDKRITLSYIPATSSDETLVTQYGGDMLNVPPYLLKVKPVLKADGIDAVTGGSVGMGTTQTFAVNIYTPAFGSDIVQNNVIAGTYSAITIQANKTPVEVAGARMEKLQNNSKNIDAVTLDDLLGELLYSIGLSYFHHLTFENDLYAKTFQMAYLKHPSEAITTLDINISYFFGIPRSASQGGLNIDVDRDVYSTASLAGDTNRSKAFMNISGMASSAWEHRIFEAFVNTPSVSAMKLLKYANQQGISILTIDSGNIGQLLSTLQISSDVKTEIQNAINAGKKVIVSQSEVQYYDWKGVGYVVLDPTTGAGAYMISGGLAGGGTATIPTNSNPPITMDKSSYSYINTVKVLRYSIMVNAIGMVGTLYGFGCKDPFTPIPSTCKNKIDCSGLVSYVYTQSGINVMGTPSNPKNAQIQYDFIVAQNGLTSYPQTGDLVFFQNTDDRNKNLKEDDGITHVGIYLWNDVMVSAGVTLGVEFYSVKGYFKTKINKQDAFVGYGTVFPSTNP
ncbi:MAG: C40 family peptidase [Nitrospinae bacterium]|nr:C40 family peptidase [Nitrospinota bacterium]